MRRYTLRGVQVQPPMWSPWMHRIWKKGLLPPAWMKVPTTEVGSWGTLLACQEWKSRLPTQPAGSVEVAPQLFLWCLDESEQSLSKSFLSCETAPFFNLCLKGAVFVGKIFCPAHIGIYRLQVAGFSMDFTGSSVVKNPPANAGDVSSTPGSGRPPGKGNGNPGLYSCLGNPMDRESWQATVHGVPRVRHDLVTKQQQGLLQYSVWAYMRQKENPENSLLCQSLGQRIPIQSAIFPLPSTIFLRLFYI